MINTDFMRRAIGRIINATYKEKIVIEQFSGYPKTSWTGHREMSLLEEFFYIDPRGKVWKAPAGSSINGATIPKALWSAVGSPYVGKYRRASVVHDVAVGEGDNPDVSLIERHKADKMFYQACRFDGCSKRFAAILYIGVSIGTWASSVGGLFHLALKISDESVGESLESQYIRKKFNGILEQFGDELDEIDFDELERRIHKLLPN